MIALLKHLVKKYLWRIAFRDKIYGKAAGLNKKYKLLLTDSPGFSEQKLNIFTRADEDGILLNIFSKIGTTNRYFVDIGSNDCINSNCANLAFHHNWNGAFVDGNGKILNRGKYIYSKHFKQAASRFAFVTAIVTTTNINEIVSSLGYSREIDLLSMDLDGNDYFIWEEISAISPRVVVTEVQVEKGNVVFIPEYNNEFEPYENNLPKGASPLSMIQLAQIKGYTLVAANRGCYNLFFVRKDCMKNLQELSAEEALKNN